MESNQVQMYQISNEEQHNNKENVVLRALVGDPNRHKPLVQHPPPTTLELQEKQPASMYTLETRYRPIPPQALPKTTEGKVYYIESNRSAPSPPFTKEERDTPILAEPKAWKNVEEEQESLPIIFLEPKIISQPILYSIVGAKTNPIPDVQLVPMDQEIPSPIFHSITGDPHRPNIDMSVSTLDVATPVIDKSPTLYTLVGSPRLQVRFQEPIKQVPEQSSPNLYSIVGSPHPIVPTQEPIKKSPQQSSPSLYSIVGNPTLTPRTTQVNTLSSSPSTQPVKAIPFQPAPILYTIVGKTHVPNNISKENYPPPALVKKQTNNVTMYSVIGDPSIPPSTIHPRKTQPPHQQQQQQVSAPLLYTVLGQPKSPSQEDMDIRPKPPVRRKSPPPVIVPARRISRSLERRPPPEQTTEGVISVSQKKHKRQAQSKEPTIPKSETTFIPLREEERPPRPKQPRTSPWYTSPETNHRSYIPSQYDPLRLPDYISPYAYHPQHRHYEQKNHTNKLPPLANNRSVRKSRSPLHEPRYRAERQHPYGPHSLERYSMNTKQRSRLWDYEHETQSDLDDDDAYEPYLTRKNPEYRRIRPRTPWIPVW